EWDECLSCHRSLPGECVLADVDRLGLRAQLARGVDRRVAAGARRERAAPIAWHGLLMQLLVRGQEWTVPPAPHVLNDGDAAANAQAAECLDIEARPIEPVRGRCCGNQREARVGERQPLRRARDEREVMTLPRDGLGGSPHVVAWLDTDDAGV